MKKGQLKELVKFLLENGPKTRDDDNYLWVQLCIKIGVMEMGKSYTIPEIMEMLAAVNYQSMRDTRQILQNKCHKFILLRLSENMAIDDIIDIRGLNYAKRHNIGEIIRVQHQPSFQDKVDDHKITSLYEESPREMWYDK